MRDGKRFRSFVLSTMVFFVLLVPLTAGAPMASGSGCDWGCESGFTLNTQTWSCVAGGKDCMRCTLRCPY